MYQGVNKGLIDVTQSLDKGNGRLPAGVDFCKYAFNYNKELQNQFIGTIQECNDADAMLRDYAKVPDDLAWKDETIKFHSRRFSARVRFVASRPRKVCGNV